MDYKKLTIGLLSPDGARYTREAADAIRYLVDRCASLEEARENANEACACWRNLYTVGRDTPEPIRSGTLCKTSQMQAVVGEPRIPRIYPWGVSKWPA